MRADVLAARVAGDQNGVIATRQLTGCGLNSRAITARVRRAQLHRVYRGIYSVVAGDLTLKARFTAAALVCGDDAVLSHFAAAAWHGLLRWSDRAVEIIVSAARAARSTTSSRAGPAASIATATSGGATGSS